MPKSKKNSKKPSVKVKDMRAKKNPKGGALNAYLKLDGVKQGAALNKATTASLKTGIKDGLTESISLNYSKIKF